MIKSISSLQVANKKVFVRVDMDVPIQKGKVLDDTRLKASVETLNTLLKSEAFVVVGGHIGRPEGNQKEYSVKPVAQWYADNFKFKISNFKLGQFDGWKLAENLFILENLRFYEGEEKNDLEFAHQLTALADIYINDAFATVHRNHASIVGIPTILPHAAGIQLKKELDALSTIVHSPQHPFVFVVGGAKIETKLPLIQKMHKVADYILVGGKIAQETRTLLKVQHEKLIGHKSALLVADLIPSGIDITPLSAENFQQIIQFAKTVVWNGPMGDVAHGDGQTTREIAEAIIQSKAYSVIGGGDTISFVHNKKLLEKFSFVSTGGGAMLSFLSGEKLPGLEALL